MTINQILEAAELAANGVVDIDPVVALHEQFRPGHCCFDTEILGLSYLEDVEIRCGEDGIGRDDRGSPDEVAE